MDQKATGSAMYIPAEPPKVNLSSREKRHEQMMATIDVPSWKDKLTSAIESQKATLFAVRTGAWSKEAYHNAFSNLGMRQLVLRPSRPHCPLAPLQHLCESWERTWPATPLPGDPLPLLWLGLSAMRSQHFDAIASQLHGCSTIAWIEPRELSNPLLSDFFRAVVQQQIACPIAFVAAFDNTAPPAGVSWLTPENENPRDSHAIQSTRIPRQTAAYLAQALLLGNAFDRRTNASLKKLSRAAHAKHRKILRDAGILSKKGAIDLEQLVSLNLPGLPSGQRWRKRAIEQLTGEEHAVSRLWLRIATTPALAPKHSIDDQCFAWSMLQLPPSHYRKLATDWPDNPRQRCLAALASLQTPGQEHLTEAEIQPLGDSHAALYRARALPLTGIQGCHQLRTLHNQATDRTIAALIALDLARWQQAIGQEQHTFALLSQYQDEPHWAIQWQRWLLFSEAYRRMGRQDMARHALTQATELAPKPMSQIMTAELRQATAALHIAPPAIMDTTPTHAQTQLDAARDTYRAMGDGRRLAAHLFLLGTQQQQRQKHDEARALYAQALSLSRQYGDGIGQQAAELKLGLLRQQVARRGM